MRVATYTDSAGPIRGSVVELSILLATILLGTGVVPTITSFIGGPLPALITPIWLLLYLGAFLGLMFHHGINWISWLVRYRILLVLLLLGTVASITWSINPQMSAERSVHLVGSTLLAIYIGFMIPLLLTLRIFAVVLALIILVSVVTAIGLPALGLESYEGTQVWKGVFNSKNDLGFWAGVGVLLYITLSESSPSIGAKLLCFMMVCVCLGALAMSQSATSLVAMLLSGTLALYLYIASRFQLGFFRMAFIAVLFVALTSLVVANIETTELVGRSGDLTGRSAVWSQVLELIFEHPLKGVGYGSLWFPTDATLWVQQSLFDFTWIVYHAHNGLLHIASEIGIPLSLIALLMVTQQLIEIFYCQYERRQVGVLFVLAFCTAFLVSNYSEARFLVTRELFWIFFLALPISMLRQINLVSPELSAGRHEEDRLSRARRHDDVQDDVRDKPWLGPQPNDTEHDALPAGYVSPAMLAYISDADNQSDESTGDLDSVVSSLSLTETDIDLGALVEEISGEHESLDLSGSVKTNDVEFIKAEQTATPDKSRAPDTFDHNDTFDIDRYDLDLNLTGEWIDIDLDDSK